MQRSILIVISVNNCNIIIKVMILHVPIDLYCIIIVYSEFMFTRVLYIKDNFKFFRS